MRNFTMIEKKIGAVHLIKFYGGQGRKYLEVFRKVPGTSKMWDQIPKSRIEY